MLFPVKKKGRCIVVSLYNNRKRKKKKSLPQTNASDNASGRQQFWKETPRCICCTGSLTVEASMVVPFLTVLFVFVLFYFRVMQIQVCVQETLEETGRKLAVFSSVREEELAVLANGYFFTNLDRNVSNYVSGGRAGFSLMGSEFEGNEICLKVNYQIKFPINLLGRKTFQMSQKTIWRKWIGWKQGGEPQEELWVYVAQNGTVYHRSADCTHLSLSIRSVPKAEVEQYRNENGGRFYPCNRCRREETAFHNVYITNYGDKYHTNLGCSGLRRTIEMVRISEVGDKGACTRCWGS